MEELKVGCSRPLGAHGEGEDNSSKQKNIEESITKEVKRMVQVGRKAPDFVAPAYYKGKFVQVKLSDYLGKWVLLCFYPGDFTFV